MTEPQFGRMESRISIKHVRANVSGKLKFGTMRTIETTLGLWACGYLSSEDVDAWAVAELDRTERPSSELLDLVVYGPERCLKRPSYDYPARPREFSYIEEFSLRAVRTSLASDDSVAAFVNWAGDHCIGEDLSLPMVELGYQLDHLVCDCHELEGAVALVREALPGLLPECQLVVQSLGE